MKNFLIIVLLIGVIASYVDQRIHIRMLQGMANECKVSLRMNMEVSRMNKAKVIQVFKDMGLNNIEANLAMGGG